jgi:WD40 repeat protein
MQVVSDEPVAPTRLQPRLNRDLETICLKCLRKQPGKRYASALDLAEDLRRFLAGEPILARPVGAIERAVKWVRRRPGVAALWGVVVLLSLAAFVVVTWFWRDAADQAELARRAEQKAIHEAGQAQLARQDALAKADDEARARADAVTQRNRAQDQEKLATQARRQSEERLERSRQLAFTGQLWRAASLNDRDPALALRLLEDREDCPIERRDFAWRYSRQLADRVTRRLAQEKGGLRQSAAAADGSMLAGLTFDGRLLLWRVSTGEKLATLDGHKGGIHCLAFSPDGGLLAAGDNAGVAWVWDTRSHELKKAMQWKFPDGRARQVLSLAFRPGGRELAAGGGFFDADKAKKDSDGRWRYAAVWVWDVDSGGGKILAASPASKGNQPRLTGGRIEDSGACTLAYSHDGKALAVGLTRESSVLILDAQTGKEQQRFRAEAGWIGGVAFSPDDRALAYGNSTSNVFVCDLAAKKVRPVMRGHLGHVHSVLFSADGKQVFSTGDDTARVWDADTGQLRTTFRCQGGARALALLDGGKQLLVTTTTEAEVWSLAAQPSVAVLRPPKTTDNGGSALAFDEDGVRLAVAGQDGRVRVWNAATRAVLHDLPGHKRRSTAVAFGPAGSDLLVSGDENGMVLLWDLKGGQGRPKFLEGHEKDVSCVAITPDGKVVLAGGADGTVWRWSAADGEILDVIDTGHGSVSGLALLEGGTLLLTAGAQGSLRVWGLKDRRPVQTLPQWMGGRTDRLAVTRDGRTAATIRGGTLALRDLTGKEKTRTLGEAGDAWSVAFTFDGRTLAVGGKGRVVRLYDVESGHLRAELPPHTHEVTALAFSRDGAYLATASRGWLPWDHRGELKLWAPPTPEKQR